DRPAHRSILRQDALCANRLTKMLASGMPASRSTVGPACWPRPARLYREGRHLRQPAEVYAAPLEGSLQALRDYGRIVPGLGQAHFLPLPAPPTRIRALHFTREGRKPHTEADADAGRQADTAATRPCWTFAEPASASCSHRRAGAATVRGGREPRPSSARSPRAAASWQPPLSRNRRPKPQQGQHEMASSVGQWFITGGILANANLESLTCETRLRLETARRITVCANCLCRHLKRCGKNTRTPSGVATPATPTADLRPQRQAYLAQAICVDGQESTGRRHSANCFNSLEDELDTATVQAAVLRELQQSVSAKSAASPEMAEAVRRLNNGQLFPLTELYAEFAAPLRLPLAKLRIVASAGHRDQALVNQLWEELLDRELAGPAGFRAVQQTLARCSADPIPAANGEDFFPAVQIVATLEKRAIEARLEEGWVVNAFCQFDYPLHRLAQAYDQLLRRRAGDPVWQSLRGYHQLLRSLICLLAKFQRAADSMPARNRQRAASQFLDMISSYQVDLRSHTDAMSVNISQRLAQIRDDLARMA
uniref:HECT domain-containing protein n=1 Tax=Macrostomum lignano TaxID=282301 RepID=A0A1I8JRE5_9PLAT